MGAWGYGPLDSDAALDWVGNNITDHVTAKVRELVKDFDAYPETYGEDIRAAAEIVRRLDQYHPEVNGFNIYRALADRLSLLRANKEWLDCWTDDEGRRQVVDEIDKQIEQMGRLNDQWLSPQPAQ